MSAGHDPLHLKLARGFARDLIAWLTRAEAPEGVKAAYLALLGKLAEEAVIVQLRGRNRYHNAAATFTTEGGAAVILVHRDGAPIDVLSELFSVAHEAGHWRSWSNGWQPAYAWTRDYLFARHNAEKVQGGKLTEPEGRLVFDEEERAWRFGREMLVDVGFSNLDDFDARAARSLGVYREVLRLHAEGEWS
jgi:hypothetical protein